MTSRSDLLAKRLPQSFVVAFCLLIAVAGAFPYGMLYAFPILAALTLHDAYRWLRISVVAIAVALFLVTIAVQVVGR